MWNAVINIDVQLFLAPMASGNAFFSIFLILSLCYADIIMLAFVASLGPFKSVLSSVGQYTCAVDIPAFST